MSLGPLQGCAAPISGDLDSLSLLFCVEFCHLAPRSTFPFTDLLLYFFLKNPLWEHLENGCGSACKKAFVQASSLIDGLAGYGILEWKSFLLSISKAWLHCLLASSPTLLEATFQIYGCCAAPFLLFLLGEEQPLPLSTPSPLWPPTQLPPILLPPEAPVF